MILFMFQCKLLDAGRRPDEFMYYYVSNHCKCDIVIQKIHYASDVPGRGTGCGGNLFDRCHHVRHT